MLKQFTAWVVLSAILVGAILLRAVDANATVASPWISSGLSIQKQADTQAVPSSLNGNIDCLMDGTINCALPTQYGTATQNSSVRLSGSPVYMPVKTYVESKPRIIPVPNSNTAISYTTEPAYGFYLYYNYNFSSSIEQVADFSANYYQITRSPDGVLADKNNHRLAADYGSMSFSQNGGWMVVSEPNVAMLRVNLSTFEVLPFAPGFNYTVGIDPSLKTAISNDGRYAVVASPAFRSWKVYDLSGCTAVPASISGPVDCQSRDLKTEISQQISGYNFASNIRFIDGHTLSAYVNYKVADSYKTARFIISNQAIASQLEYLALGDSYISGEGAFNYQSGTDDTNNHCHLSSLSYPSLIGHDLNYNSYHSVACSGARAGHITDTSIPASSHSKVQAKGKDSSSFDDEIYNSFLPGYRAQISFVNHYQPNIVTLSIGGNDLGFSNILQNCVLPKPSGTCYNTYTDRLELVNQINSTVYPRLVQAYQQVKTASPTDARLYVIGYPQIAKPDGDCGLNVHLNNDEIIFARQLISYLDTVIKAAASKAGAYYVDTQEALNGHRLCEAGPGSVAVNGLTTGNDSPSKIAGPIGNESYHPNPFGYELLENKILADTHNLTAPMPPPDINAALPALINQDILNVPADARQVKSIQYDDGITGNLAFQQVPIDISINGAAHSLRSNSSLAAEIHSEPVSLGNFNIDQNGNLSGQLTVPSIVPAGYHSLHFYGTNVDGQPVDIYKFIYLAFTADDLDGDGALDSTQGCVGVPDSGQDNDEDGVDDACDPTITVATVARSSVTPETSVGLTRQTNSTSFNSKNGTSSDKSTVPRTAVLGAMTSQPVVAQQTRLDDNLRLSSADVELAILALILLTGLVCIIWS